jgi:hypothetical protein
MLSMYELIELQTEALFVHDTAGRIVRDNEPDGAPALRFFVGRTPSGNIWRVRDDVPDDLAHRLTALAAREPVEPEVSMVPRLAPEILGLFDDAGIAASASGGPAFYFGDQIPAPEGVVRVDASNASLLLHFPSLPALLEHRRPCFAVVRDGIAVSVCYSSRRTGRAAEAGVDTLPAYRGNGYATAVTAAWGRAVRTEGLVPLYSTSWDNTASRGVARRLGLVQYGVDWGVE